MYFSLWSAVNLTSGTYAKKVRFNCVHPCACYNIPSLKVTAIISEMQCYRSVTAKPICGNESLKQENPPADSWAQLVITSVGLWAAPRRTAAPSSGFEAPPADCPALPCSAARCPRLSLVLRDWACSPGWACQMTPKQSVKIKKRGGKGSFIYRQHFLRRYTRRPPTAETVQCDTHHNRYRHVHWTIRMEAFHDGMNRINQRSCEWSAVTCARGTHVQKEYR